MRERMLHSVCANAGTEDRCSKDCKTQRQSRVVWSLGRGLKLSASRSLAIFALLSCPWPLRAGGVRRHLIQTSKGHGETGQRGGALPRQPEVLPLHSLASSWSPAPLFLRTKWEHPVLAPGETGRKAGLVPGFSDLVLLIWTLPHVRAGEELALLWVRRGEGDTAGQLLWEGEQKKPLGRTLRSWSLL